MIKHNNKNHPGQYKINDENIDLAIAVDSC